LVLLTATKPISAAATAAIVTTTSPVSIGILHPSLSGALSMNGNSKITICGGPQLAIQVNSYSSTAASIGGTVDLSKAGPNDLLRDCHGTGSDFGNFGGPSSPGTVPSWLLVGSDGHYYQPHPPVPDPFLSVTEPTAPGFAPEPQPIATGGAGGDCTDSGGCTLYSPGKYPTAAGARLIVKNNTAIFKPGLYYVSSAATTGPDKDLAFSAQSNAVLKMCSASCDTSVTNFSSNGMMVFMSQGVVSLTSNGSISLTGSDTSGIYKGLLFFGARSAANHDGQGSTPQHTMGGGASMELTGSIYLTNTDALMRAGTYQMLSFNGNPGSHTNVDGMIIVSALNLSGTSTIKMTLNALLTFSRDEFALVN
jgi:hypothetical protein